MIADTRLGWLLEDISLQIPLKASTLELSPSDHLDSVIFLAKLNNLEVWGADIRNACLEAKTKEELYVVAGPELRNLRDIYWLSTKHYMD